MAMLAMPKFLDGTPFPRWQILLELDNGYMMSESFKTRRDVRVAKRNFKTIYGSRIRSLKVKDVRPDYIAAGWKPPKTRRR